MIKQLNTPFDIEVYLTEDSASKQLTGLTVYLKLFRKSDDFYYDFDDNTFKANGHTTIENTLTEKGNGVYYYTFPNDSSIEDVYVAKLRYTYLNTEYAPRITYEVISIASDSKLTELQNVLYKYDRVLNVAENKAYYYDENGDLVFTATFTTTANEQTYGFST